MKDLAGKTAFITGSTDGVGRLVAARLAARGAHVLIHGRDRDRADSLKKEIESAGGTALSLIADLSRLSNAAALADVVLKMAPKLDLFISNAGIGFGGPDRELSQDGHELRFAVNYLAGYVMAEKLKARIVDSAPARIVFVSSIGQYKLDFNDLMIEHGYNGGRSYRQSKLAQILYAFELANELKGKGVTVNALHPSTLMNTTMVSQSGMPPQSKVETGADAIMRLAADPELEGVTGRYFDVFTDTRANEQAYDELARRKLLKVSKELTGV